MATVPAEIHGPSDAELIESVRGGRVDAYGSLYERHVSAAYNLARQLARSSAEADDLVSEAFARVLDTLRAGRGPDSAFRAYLLTALRHVAYDKTRKDRKVELTDDVETVSGVSTEKISEPFRDTAVAGLERSLAAKAFARLPERWQAVLWHTEIEGQSPAEVAPLLGLTANGVSALAYRAREGLRQAYLQVHLAETTADRCRATADKLGAWTRGGLSKRETTQVETHLDECDRCRALAAELADVNGGLRVVATLVLGLGTVGYLATTAKATTGVALAAAATTSATAGAASGAAGAASSLPRQFVGVGASVAALAAALALALTGTHSQSIPTAAPIAPPSRTAPAAPPNNAPPAPPAAPPAVPPVVPPVVPPPVVPPVVPPVSPVVTTTPTTPPTTTTPPPVAPPTTTPPTTTTTPPPPAVPRLSASGPTDPITLVPGGDAVELPITATNEGTGPSGPVTARLTLPPGVSTSGPADALSTHSLHSQQLGTSPQAYFAPQATPNGQDPTSTTVDCPAGATTCKSPTGLQPGQTVVLVFRLIAAANTEGGTITGVVSDGQSMDVDITANVLVKAPPPPPLVDALSLTAHLDQWDTWLTWLWDGEPVLDVTATNTGTSTKPVTIIVNRPGSLWSPGRDVRCEGEGQEVACTSTEPLAPKQSLRLRLHLYHLHPLRDVVTVVGSLGSATRTVTLKVVPPPCHEPWCWGSPPTSTNPPTSDDPPTTTTEPPTSKPTRTTEPSQPNGPVKPTTGRSTPPDTGTKVPPPPGTVVTDPPTSNPPSSEDPAPPTEPTCPSEPTQSGKLQPGGINLCLPPILGSLSGLLGPL